MYSIWLSFHQCNMCSLTFWPMQYHSGQINSANSKHCVLVMHLRYCSAHSSEKYSKNDSSLVHNTIKPEIQSKEVSLCRKNTWHYVLLTVNKRNPLQNCNPSQKGSQPWLVFSWRVMFSRSWHNNHCEWFSISIVCEGQFISGSVIPCVPVFLVDH